MQPVTAGKPKRKSPAWVKDAADRAEGKAPREPILDREEKGQPYRTSVAAAVAAKRRHKGTAVDTLASDLPTLPPKQLAFVKAWMDGSASNAAEAYQIAYGPASSRKNLWIKASLLAAHPNVKAWMQAYRLAGLDDGMTSVNKHVSELTRIKEAALASGDFKAAVMAETNKGRIAGLYEARLIVEHRANDGALIDALTRTLGAETAQQLAVALGVKALPGDSARPIMLDATIGDSPVTVTAGEDDKDED